MKHVLAAAGLAGLLAFSSAAFAQSDTTSSGSGSSQTDATPASCQPLTASNRDVCCNAPNWKEIISGDDAAYCPSTGADDTVRLGREFPNDDGADSNQLENSNDSSGSGNNAGGNAAGGNNNSNNGGTNSTDGGTGN